MINKTIKTIFGFLMLFALMSGVNATWTLYDWSITGTHEGANALEVKTTGTPCYLFKDTITNQIIYECLTPSTDLVVFSGFTGTQYSLAFDALNNPHVCFVNGSMKAYYATLSGGSFVIDSNFTVNESEHCDGCALDIDASNKPHILLSCETGTSKQTREKFKSGSNVWVESAALVGSGGVYTTFRIAQDGYKYYTASIGGNYVYFGNSTPSTNTAYTTTAYSVIPPYLYDMEISNNHAVISYMLWSTTYIAYQDVLHSSYAINTFSNLTVSASYGKTSIATYLGNIYLAYVSSGNLYELDNATVAPGVPVLIAPASNSYIPTIAIDSSGNKWISYTSASNTVMLAYEAGGTYITPTGTLKNCASPYAPISARVCIDSTSGNCAFTGGGGVFTLPSYVISGIHTIFVDNAFGGLYADYNGSYLVSASSISICLTTKIYDTTNPELVANAASIRLQFITATSPQLPISNLSVTVTYTQCPGGCTSCCTYAGTIIPGTTNATGEFSFPFLYGTYSLSIQDGSNIFDESIQDYATEVYFTVTSNPLTQYKQYAVDLLNLGWTIDGYVVDDSSHDGIPNARVYFFGLGVFNATTNASGYFIIENVPKQTLQSYKSIIASNYTLSSSMVSTFGNINDVPCTDAGDNEIKCSWTFLMSYSGARTYTLNGTIVDINGGMIDGVTVNLRGDKLTRQSTTTSNGSFSFPGLSDLNQYFYLNFSKTGYLMAADNPIKLYLIGDYSVQYMMFNASQIPHACINITVLSNTTSEPISYASVSITSSTPSSTDANGKVSFCNVISSKRYTILITPNNANYGAKIFTIYLNNSGYTETIYLPPTTLKYYAYISIENCNLDPGLDLPYGDFFLVTGDYTNLTLPSQLNNLTHLTYSTTANSRRAYFNNLNAGTYSLYFSGSPRSKYTYILEYLGLVDIPLSTIGNELEYCVHQSTNLIRFTIYYNEVKQNVTYLYYGTVGDVNTFATDKATNETYTCKSDTRGLCVLYLPKSAIGYDITYSHSLYTQETSDTLIGKQFISNSLNPLSLKTCFDLHHVQPDSLLLNNIIVCLLNPQESDDMIDEARQTLHAKQAADLEDWLYESVPVLLPLAIILLLMALMQASVGG